MANKKDTELSVFKEAPVSVGTNMAVNMDNVVRTVMNDVDTAYQTTLEKLNALKKAHIENSEKVNDEIIEAAIAAAEAEVVESLLPEGYKLDPNAEPRGTLTGRVEGKKNKMLVVVRGINAKARSVKRLVQFIRYDDAEYPLSAEQLQALEELRKTEDVIEEKSQELVAFRQSMPKYRENLNARLVTECLMASSEGRNMVRILSEVRTKPLPDLKLLQAAPKKK